jgi:hypothetical protein
MITEILCRIEECLKVNTNKETQINAQHYVVLAEMDKDIFALPKRHKRRIGMIDSGRTDVLSRLMYV